MKPFRKFNSTAMCILLALFMPLAIVTASYAQDSVSAKSPKKEIVVLKMTKDVNGKTTVIDTSFTISTPSGHEALEKYLEEHEAELESLGEKLRNIDMALTITDSADLDSLTSMALALSNGKCIPHFKWHHGPGAFNYDFDIPCPEEFDFDFPENEESMKYFFPDRDVRIMKYGDKGSTLADIIGDIPMSRVKSYSIKEKKGGKRIVIEVENGPSMVDEDRVIIINKQGGKGGQGHSGGKEKRVKVIVEPEENN